VHKIVRLLNDYRSVWQLLWV